MELNRVTLLKDLKKALPGLDNGKAPIVGADTFLFSNEYLHTYNSRVGLSIPVATQGLTCAVKAQDLYKLLVKASADIITLELCDTSLKYKVGKNRGKLAIANSGIQAYVDALKIEDLVFAEIPSGFSDGARLCRVEDSAIGGIAIDKDKIMSADGRVATMFTMGGEMVSVWLPDSAVKDMLKIGEPVAYHIGESWAHFRFDDGTIFSCATKDFSTFPTQKFLNRMEAVALDDTCLTGKLPTSVSAAVDRVSIFAESKNGITPIGMELTREFLLLHSSKSGGDSEEEVSWETPWDSDEVISCMVDGQFLRESYRKTVDFYFKDIGEDRVLVFTSESFMVATAV